MSGAGLWDPWETHYGEVARNIITRGDPMDLRYKPGYGPDGLRENQFRSKHVLPFWGMAAGLWVFDTGDQAAADEMVASSKPLWALRLPSMLMALWGVGALVRALHRCVNPKVAFVCAVAFATLPQFLMMARQATTDMYALAPMCAAIGTWIALQYGEDRRFLRVRWRGIAVPMDWSLVGFLLLWTVSIALPTWVLFDHVTSARIVDMVASWPKKPSLPDTKDLERIAEAMVMYGIAAVVFLQVAFGAKRLKQLQTLTLYILAGWALMGKGLLVPGLLAVVFVLDLVRTRRLGSWQRLYPLRGLVFFFLSCAPWHHAMAIFRKDAWVHELLIQNNLERFLSGEQAQAVGDFSFYPTVLLVACGVWVFAWPSVRSPAPQPVLGFAKLGAGVSLAVISVSATKYSHYAAVTLPFFAICAAHWLAQPVQAAKDRRGRGLFILFLVLLGGGVGWLHWIEPARLVHLTTYLNTGIWRDGAGTLWPYVAVLGAACIWRGLYLLFPLRLERVFLPGFLGLAMASAWALMLVYVPESSRAWSQAELIGRYYQDRGPKDELASWWFYHRGETFYTKRKVWMQASPEPTVLRAKIREMRDAGADLWFVTNPLHLDRLREHLPRTLRDKLEMVEQRPHQVLARLPL